MNKEDIIKEMERRIKGNSSYHYKNAVDLYNTYDFLHDIWDYKPYEMYIKDRFVRKLNPESLPQQEVEMPESSGVYMIGTTAVNPYTGEEFFWVKVGQSDNLYDRVKTYNIYNPTMWKANYLLIKKEDLRNVEKFFHIELEKICMNRSNTSREWFQVSKQDYILLCEKGFNYFYNDEKLKIMIDLAKYFKYSKG